MATIRVNQFTDGKTGHVNISFLDSSGNVQVTYGANLSPSVGVQMENNETAERIANPGSGYRYHDINVSQAAYDQALAFATAADRLHNEYSAFCNNCVDFANAVLNKAGMGNWAIKDYLQDGSLTDIYANLAQFLCTNPYNALMDTLPGEYTFTPPTYVSNFYASIFGSYPAFWTSDYLELYDFLRGELGVSSWDDYVASLAEDYAAFGSPVAIDLNGDGLHTLALAGSQVVFDITGDGRTEKTAWLSASDGFIVMDRNGNGTIDSVNEMFGGGHRGEGYAELGALDSNKDHVLNASDASYIDLMVWQDANGNGVSEKEELQTLRQRGVAEMSLVYTSSDTYRESGNLIGEVSVATVNGVQVEMGDIYFRHETTGPDLI